MFLDVLPALGKLWCLNFLLQTNTDFKRHHNFTSLGVRYTEVVVISQYTTAVVNTKQVCNRICTESLSRRI